VLGSVLLSVVYQWDNYDELHFMQDGEHLHTWRFLVGGLGVEEQKTSLRQVLVLLNVIYLCEAGRKMQSIPQMKKITSR
jgi:hypothetical protein